MVHYQLHGGPYILSNEFQCKFKYPKNPLWVVTKNLITRDPIRRHHYDYSLKFITSIIFILMDCPHPIYDEGGNLITLSYFGNRKNTSSFSSSPTMSRHSFIRHVLYPIRHKWSLSESSSSTMSGKVKHFL